MSKFVSVLALAFILVATAAHAGITIVDGDATSSGAVNNTTSYAVNLPTGITDGDLVVVAIASSSRATPSAENYLAVEQGFKSDANGCFEFYHVWKQGDSTNPVFSRATAGSDAYAVAVLSNVQSGAFVDDS